MTIERASKKQQELLQFVDGFIKGNGYGPSYREVMRALDYKSVSTVAIHINQLIAKGYLEKSDNSARSLSVVSMRPGLPQNVSNPKDAVVKKVFEEKLRSLDADSDEDKRQTLHLAAEILEIELSD